MEMRLSRGHDCHRWKMLTEDTGAVSVTYNGKVKEMAIDPNHDIPELCDLSFKRCPYCGDPLDIGHTSRVKLELNTERYQKKRLDNFIEQILPKYGKVIDVFKYEGGIHRYKHYNIVSVLLEVKGDGDKVAMSIQHHPEIDRAFDKRHERITLN